MTNFDPSIVRQTLTLAAFFLVANSQVCSAAAQPMTVTVTGAVASPGPRTLTSDAHLNDALRLAAPALNADLTTVQITHKGSGSPEPTDTVDYSLYLDSQQTSGNPPLHDGDAIDVLPKIGIPIRVYMRGEVVHSGWLQVPSQSTLVDAIGQAGGLTPDASLADIAIQHSGSSDQSHVGYTAADKNLADPALNPVLLDGDTVIVQAAEKPNVFTITGAVLHPGQYSLPDTPANLADALGQAGGPADHAKLQQILIVRTGADGKITKITVKGSDPATQKATPVLAGDNIMVPQGSPPQHIDPLQAIGLAVSVIAISRH